MIAETLGQPGLVWLLAAALVAGLVRGFSGFGTALVFLPVAGRILNPVEALTVLLAMDLIGPLPNVPRALRDTHLPDLARLGAGMVVALPIGLWMLTAMPPDVFRTAVSLISLVMLVLLSSGLRYRGRLSPPVVVAAGAAGGILGGAAGLPGPPVILLYMASTLQAAAIRATLLLYLVIVDVASLGILGLYGRLEAGALALGLMLAAPYLLANVAGAAMFRPQHGRLYRGVAYAIIAASALTGLPLLD